MGLASVARGHGGFQFERPERRDLRQRLQGTGFVILSELPNEEIVISVAGAILASRWRAVHGTHREGFCPIFSLRLRQGSMELQTASRLAAKFGSFKGDEDQVFRTGRSVEIPVVDYFHFSSAP
jgi:hypothetical protein